MEIDTGNILDVDEPTLKKAELISYGSIEIPRHLYSHITVERSKSGPSSGKDMITFEFSKRRVKLEVSKQRRRFRLGREDDRFFIYREDKKYIEVKPLRVRSHAPDQVFISLENRCIYNCLFCKKSGLVIDDERLIGFVKRMIDTGEAKSIAITSGAFPTVRDQIERISRFIKRIRLDYPDIPIGVEPLIGERENVSVLKSAGANEIKINIQFPTDHLFKKMCPGLNYERIFKFLEFAVDEFDRGKVTSNIIYGVGESDYDIYSSIERLAEIGVVPNLRMIRMDSNMKSRIERELGYTLDKVGPERMIRLSLIHKEILKRNNLTTRSFKTMCFPCGCCDIVPFWDV